MLAGTTACLNDSIEWSRWSGQVITKDLGPLMYDIYFLNVLDQSDQYDPIRDIKAVGGQP